MELRVAVVVGGAMVKVVVMGEQVSNGIPRLLMVPVVEGVEQVMMGLRLVLGVCMVVAVVAVEEGQDVVPLTVPKASSSSPTPRRSRGLFVYMGCVFMVSGCSKRYLSNLAWRH